MSNTTPPSPPTVGLKLDKMTLEAQLARAIQDKASIEQLGTQKQNDINKLNADLEQLKGALQYNAVVIDNIKKDIAALPPSE